MTPDATTFIEFIELTSTNFSRVAILLDAFDECLPDERYKILKLVTELQRSDIRVYITTRPHYRTLLTEKVDGLVFKQILAREEDIKLFLEHRMKSEKLNNKLKAEIMSAITQHAQGMYAILSSSLIPI